MMSHSPIADAIQSNIDRFGLHIQMVGGVVGDDPLENFQYTIGNREKDYPELIVSVFTGPTVAAMMNHIRAKLDDGYQLKLGVNSDLFSVPVKFARCRADVRSEVAVQNYAHYDLDDDYELWQMILSGRNGRLPGEEGCETIYTKQKYYGPS